MGNRVVPILTRASATAVLVAGLAVLLPGCSSGPGANPSDRRDDADLRSEPGGDVRFEDVAPAVGIDRISRSGDLPKNHLLESTGSGVAIADYDGDGDDDVYLPTAQTTEDWRAGRRPRANALYRQEADGTFTEVAAEAGVDHRGWSAGAYFADYDNDGDRDLFVTAWGPNVLYRNEGDGTFTDVTREAGVAGPDDAWSASAAFGDLDGDGDLDLYVANYCEYDLADPPYGGTKTTWKGIRTYRGPLGFVGQPDELYRNDGDGTFTDVTVEAGIDDRSPPLYGLGVVMADFDDDRDPDIYVANDSCPNYLWRNDGGLRFTDVAAVAGVATNEDAKEQAGMGTDAGDFDGDGRIDLAVTNFSHDWNTLYRNEGSLTFTDHTFQGGLKDTYLSLAWGVKLFDYDNDGWLDLLIANGHIYSEVDAHPHLNTTYKQVNSLFRNAGDGRFEDVTARAGPGLAAVEGTRGLAVSDLDRDGDLDVVLTNMDGAPSVLRNEGGNRNAWLSVELRGTRSNRDGIGARLVLEAGGRTLTREANPFGSYQSQGGYATHFGLGTSERVDRLVVLWPSGTEQTLTDLPARRRMRIDEDRGVLEGGLP